MEKKDGKKVSKKSKTPTTISKFKKYCKETDLDELLKFKEKCDDAYYNSDKPEISDKLYDFLKATVNERMKEKNPSFVLPVGCKIREGENRVDLPFWLGSLETFTAKEEKQIERWLEKNKSSHQMVSEKLDGISGLLFIENGIRKLFGRGDGNVGADLSHIIPYLNLPVKLPDNLAIRGELIMVKETFEKKYSSVYKNPRNMVAGLIGSKTVKIPEALNDLHFITYEIVGDETMHKPSDQHKQMSKLGFEVCKSTRVASIKTLEELETLHKNYKQETIFDIDGIVIQSDLSYDRNISGDPSYMFAFKMRSNENIAQTTVVDIEWEISRLGSVIPVIVVEPVELPGVSVSRITGSNAGLLEERKIGIGSIVNVTRSKDVIPYILDVLTEGTIIYPKGFSYKWDTNRVNLLANKNDAEVKKIIQIKQIAYFFGNMNIKHISDATVKKLYENGYDTLVKIVASKKEDLIQKGFGEKTAERITANIATGLRDVDIPLLMSSSGVLGMGIGTKRISELINNVPTLFSETDLPSLKERILKIEGFSEIMTNKILTHLPDAINFIDEMTPYLAFKTSSNESDSLLDTKFVFSGFRSKELELYITNRKGKITTSVSKKTTGLIVSSKTEQSVKMENANKNKVPVYTKEEFLEIYK
jgi:NAD-dependent DNA ligase